MLRRFFLFGAMILTLGIGAINATSVYATAEPTSATTRPSQLELQSAIFRLEQLGDYQTYFGPNSSATLSNQVPHYQEYLYLYNLVTSTQNLVNHYHDTEYLTQHHISDTTFRDALIEMQHAYRGCFLLLGLANDQSTTTHPVAQATTSISNSSNSAKAPANNTNQTTAKKPLSANATDKTAAKATSAAATTKVASNQADHTSGEITADEANTTINTNNATNTANVEVAVPNTGEATGTAGLAARRVSWPALLAVVITGALVASIAIAVIVRHEPRRSNRARRRY